MATSEEPVMDAEEAIPEICEYTATDTVYSLGWSRRPDQRFRLAYGTYIEDYCNKINVIKLDQSLGTFTEVVSFSHPYPATKVEWIPDKTGTHEDLMASAGDYLRIWQIDAHNPSSKTKPKCLLDSNKNVEVKFCAPLTSFDWNEVNLNIIGTSSVDTTCTIWDIETQQAKTQVIAHDKEVYDIGFQSKNPDIFASVGADGSLRSFDLRSLEQSTIMYEHPDNLALLRLAWCKQQEHHVAVVAADSTDCVVLDIRYPSRPYAELKDFHSGCVNGISWAPHSESHLSTGAEDSHALIWDTQSPAKPSLAYSAGAEINQLKWSALHPSWISIAFADRIQILRV